MFADLRRLFGAIKVTESNGVITCEGLPADEITENLKQIMLSNVVTKYILINLTRSGFSFPSFFAIEMDYLLRELVNHPMRRVRKNAVKALLAHLHENTWLKNIQSHEMESPLDRTQIHKMKFDPLEHQRKFLGWYEWAKPRYGLKGCLLAAAAGGGKAQPLSVKIKTPSGWVKMGNVQVGQIISTPDGNEARVKGVYPQGLKNSFMLTTIDGRKTPCCDEHLWEVFLTDDPAEVGQVITTLQIQERLLTQVCYIRCPYVTQVQSRAQRVNGAMAATIVGRRQDTYSPILMDKIKNSDRVTRQEFLRAIQNITKYKGLIKPLADDVQYIVRSLGGIAYKYPEPIHPGRYALRVHIPNHVGEGLRVKVAMIINLEMQEVMQCISIDSPDQLYITDDFITTHNTYTAMLLSFLAHADTVVVVSPNNAIYSVWEKSIRTMPTEKQTVWVSQDADPPPDNCKWFVFNYEALDKAHAMVGKMKHGKVVVILDESHSMNSGESMRTELFLKLCRDLNPVDTLWLSGTPIKALGAEAVPLFRCIAADFTEDVERRFKKIYAKDSEVANKMLSHRLGLVAYKVPKGDFMTDIPPPIEKTIYVKVKGGDHFTLENMKTLMVNYVRERTVFYAKHRIEYERTFDAVMKIAGKALPPEQQQNLKVYQKNVKEISKGFDPRNLEMVAKAKFCNRFEKNHLIPLLLPQMKQDFKQAKSVIKYVDLKIRGECLGNILGKQRAAAIEAMVPFVPFKMIMDKAEKKTLIFTSYVNVVNATVKLLSSEGYHPVAVHAAFNSDLRGILDKLENDPKVDPCAATFQSLSTAVPVIFCDTEIMLNSPFRSHEMEQAIARVYRIGQDTQPKIWHVFLDTGDMPNISTRSGDIMEWSREQVSQIMGFDSRTDLDFALEAEYSDVPTRVAHDYYIDLDRFDEDLTSRWVPPRSTYSDYLHWCDHQVKFHVIRL